MEDCMMRSIGPALRVPCMGLLLMTAALADSQPSASTQSVNEVQPYVLHAEDEVSVRSLQAKEIADKTFRLDQNGEVNFPLAGVVHLGGNTVRDAEKALAAAFKTFYINPDIAITVTAFHSEPVSVLGAVGTPNVYQLKGRTRLIDALSAAGGARPDAGATVTITRRPEYGPIPMEGARQLLSGESVAEINLKSLLESRDSKENFLIEPHDVISVSAAQFVYVLGNVKRAGGYPLAGRPNLSVLDALALSEGADSRANLSKAQILRRSGPTPEQIPVDIAKILRGKAEDPTLQPNDVLFLPNNVMKTVTIRTIESAIQIGTGILIFHQ
jgi:polysaccharide export outer membrane protein